jgi:hypothetical protein
VGDSFSCVVVDRDQFHHPFLWEHGAIVDLDALIPVDSPLELVVVGPLSFSVQTLNDRGEIAGVGVQKGVDPGNMPILVKRSC